MNIKQALLHNTGWKIITMLFAFVNNIIIVRLLGAEASAGFLYVLAAFTLLSTLLRFGLENGIIWYTSKYPQRTGPLISFLFIVILIQTVISFFVLKLFIHQAVYYTLFWSLVFVMGNVFFYYVTAFYQVKRMYISINVSSTVITFFQTAVLLLFYFSERNFLIQSGIAKNINEALLVLIGSGLLLQLFWLCIYFYNANKKDFINLRPEAVSVNRVFKYSLINFTGTVLMFLVMRADFYFVEKYCNSISFANYIQVAKIGQMALVFPGLLGGVIFPFTVNASDAFAGKIAFFCRLLSLVFLILFTAYLATGRYIFTWLLGRDFNLMYQGLGGTFAGIYCLAINLVLISYFEGKNMQKIILSSSFVTLIVLIVGDYFLVPAYGFMAAAVIFSVANFAGFVILLTYFIKKTATPIKEILFFTPGDLTIFKFWR